MKPVERDLSKCASNEYYTSQKGECRYLKLEKCIPVKTIDKNHPTVYYQETTYR